MKKKIYWKDIFKSFTGSLGRFLSITVLMFLGAFALLGLKVVSPDMQKTAIDYLSSHKTMDLSVIASSGLSKADQDELKQTKGATVEFAYMTDVTTKDKDDAVRVFSKTKTLSQYQLVSGHLPRKSNQIALSETLKKDYKIGGTITFKQKSTGILRVTSYKIVGFVKSSEIWSYKNLGSSTAGDGNLTGYAVTPADSFSSPVYSLARLRYDDLKNLNPFSTAYTKGLEKKQEALDQVLADNGTRRLAEIKKDKEAGINQAQSKLNQAQAELNQQEKLLPYLSGPRLAAAQAALAQGKAKLAQNQASIKDTQTKLNQLATPTYQTYSRTTLPGGEGYQTYRDISRNVNQIGNIFPVVLYLVAALVTFTTMTRFVNEERTNSGLLKALGYSNNDVIKKFVIYGLVASLLGTTIGIIGGHYFLPAIIVKNAVKLTVIKNIHFYFYWSYTLLAFALAFISAVLPAFLVAKRELSEKPAQLLLPKPPVAGSKILLERLGFIWRRLSFTQKVTMRNIFRYKQRMAMTVFGVAGSLALLFSGLGLQSSLGKMVDHQFGQLTSYDMLVLRNSQADKAEQAKVDSYLKSDQVASYQTIHSEKIDEKIKGQDEKKTITLMTSQQRDFGNFIHLLDVKTGKSLKLPKEGAIITQKLAEFYQVEVGDKLSFKDQDGKKQTIKVAAIAQMNTGHYIFMKDSYYQSIFGHRPDHNSDLVNLKNHSAKQLSKQSSYLLSLTAISGLTQNSTWVSMIKTAVNGLNASMTILVVTSVVLAIVILYNLTNINVAERIRELSTIKVLGFHSYEVMLYIYRETILLSLVGMVLGLIGGYYLHDIIITMMSQDRVYPLDMDLHVYYTPVLVITGILLALGWVVYCRLKTVDMLEALKSVD
ncbi:ABC transporter permease [Streptococcus sobrinus]|uniref:ABC transporter permease n=2 Tax=Streptococcus sobrinus TaxID=1310 RepID=UPI0003127111|nr:ABC transporter permease [Streptococcus sobrinus]